MANPVYKNDYKTKYQVPSTFEWEGDVTNNTVLSKAFIGRYSLDYIQGEVAAAVGAMQAAVSATAPTGGEVGDLWFDTVNLSLKVLTYDGNSLQWVAS